MNVSLSECSHSNIIVHFFPTVLAIGGTDKHKMFTHTHVNTLLFTGWELKVEKTTESRIPS